MTYRAMSKMYKGALKTEVVQLQEFLSEDVSPSKDGTLTVSENCLPVMQGDCRGDKTALNLFLLQDRSSHIYF